MTKRERAQEIGRRAARHISGAGVYELSAEQKALSGFLAVNQCRTCQGWSEGAQGLIERVMGASLTVPRTCHCTPAPYLRPERTISFDQAVAELYGEEAA